MHTGIPTGIDGVRVGPFAHRAVGQDRAVQHDFSFAARDRIVGRCNFDLGERVPGDGKDFKHARLLPSGRET